MGFLDCICHGMCPVTVLTPCITGADPGFFKRGGGVHLRSTSKKKGGRGGGPILGPMLKSLHSGPKRGWGSG